jgi:hypothetical protein
MTLPASGAISFNAINVELGQAGTTSANINQASYRTLAGVPSGTIALSNFYGKSNQFSLTISANQTNLNLGTYASANGWNGSSKLAATINSGVYISSNSTGTPALTVSGSFPGGVSLVNNGTIAGMGGNGGGGATGGGNGNSGGLALSVSSAITITNNNVIAGGGGGGGGGGAGSYNFGTKAPFIQAWGGGGGGGGQSSTTNSSGGSGGTAPPGSSPSYRAPGSAGSGGTSSSAGGGGNGGSYGGITGGSGGSGGSWGSSGSSGNVVSNGFPTNGGGPYSGGSGGGAVSGNANITWVATGTRYGGIS